MVKKINKPNKRPLTHKRGAMRIEIPINIQIFRNMCRFFLRGMNLVST